MIKLELLQELEKLETIYRENYKQKEIDLWWEKFQYYGYDYFKITLEKVLKSSYRLPTIADVYRQKEVKYE